MYFLDIKELKHQLSVNPLTDRETLPYFLVGVLAFSLCGLLPKETGGFWDKMMTLLGSLIFVCGTIYAYRQNLGNQGHHFLQRYLSVGWVVSVRWVLACAVISIPIMFYWLAITVMAFNASREMDPTVDHTAMVRTFPQGMNS